MALTDVGHMAVEELLEFCSHVHYGQNSTVCVTGKACNQWRRFGGNHCLEIQSDSTCSPCLPLTAAKCRLMTQQLIYNGIAGPLSQTYKTLISQCPIKKRGGTGRALTKMTRQQEICDPFLDLVLMTAIPTHHLSLPNLRRQQQCV